MRRKVKGHLFTINRHLDHIELIVDAGTFWSRYSLGGRLGLIGRLSLTFSHNYGVNHHGHRLTRRYRKEQAHSLVSFLQWRLGYFNGRCRLCYCTFSLDSQPVFVSHLYRPIYYDTQLEKGSISILPTEKNAPPVRDVTYTMRNFPVMLALLVTTESCDTTTDNDNIFCTDGTSIISVLLLDLWGTHHHGSGTL